MLVFMMFLPEMLYLIFFKILLNNEFVTSTFGINAYETKCTCMSSLTITTTYIYFSIPYIQY